MDPQSPAPADLLQELGNLLRAALTSTSTPQSASASPMALPASYVGEPAGCGGFLLQVSLYIEAQLQEFSTDCTKVAFLISLLSGRVLQWAKAIWDANSVMNNSYEAFTTQEVFGSSADEISVTD
ncbi:protein LDOC1-like [Cyprinus carpio]|uniref:Protein LDOC1-like n=1 Tax=Cyprinus carpio TaxID=7962 RepID=A0A9Q9ZI30_CYPCA|nr:protein LDOC1-like [Cyprinus carpio]